MGRLLGSKNKKPRVQKAKIAKKVATTQIPPEIKETFIPHTIKEAPQKSIYRGLDSKYTKRNLALMSKFNNDVIFDPIFLTFLELFRGLYPDLNKLPGIDILQIYKDLIHKGYSEKLLPYKEVSLEHLKSYLKDGEK